ncbi:MAG TPA: 4Fe-4S binding protein [Candidatus Faecousia intestinigallinarum]|nr:4Fe-4S binding protein [Candidatus Faecousia intestinigallinarum]
MIHIQNKTDCCGCHACAQICPRHCITMQPDAEGFLYPQIDETACIHCNLCEKVCPILQSPQEPKDKTPTAYAAINKDDDIRGQSSSGGVFRCWRNISWPRAAWCSAQPWQTISAVSGILR